MNGYHILKPCTGSITEVPIIQLQVLGNEAQTEVPGVVKGVGSIHVDFTHLSGFQRVST